MDGKCEKREEGGISPRSCFHIPNFPRKESRLIKFTPPPKEYQQAPMSLGPLCACVYTGPDLGKKLDGAGILAAKRPSGVGGEAGEI